MGSFGLWRSVVRRDRADRAVALAAALLLLAATTLVVSAVMYGETVASGSLRRSVAIAPPAARAVSVRTTVSPAEAASVEATVAGELAAALGPAGGEISRVSRSGPLSVVGQQAGGPDDLTIATAYDALGAHATLVDGRWPHAGADPIEATLSEAAARALGLAVGDRVTLASRSDPSRSADVHVTGIWRPAAGDAFWMGSALELGGVVSTGSFTTRGPFVVDGADLARLPGRTSTADVEWRALPAVDALATGDLDRMADDLAGLRERLRTVVTPTREVAVTTDLPALLRSVSRSVAVSRSGILLLTLQFGVLALYAILLVAGMVVDRRRLDIALLRSRGASSAHLAGMALLEAVLLALPAVVLAPVLGLGVVRLLGAIGPLADAGIVADVAITPAAIAVSVGAAAIAVAAFVVPSVVSAANPGGVRASWGRQIGRTLPQRLGLDLVLVAVAALAIWQLSLYGTSLTRDARGALGVDPLLILAPAIGLVAGGVLAIRFLPRVAEVGERLIRRGRGVVAPLGARQIARRPLRATRSTLLVLLAAALFVVAASYAATWTRSQGDQSAYRAAADVRAVVSEYAATPAWAVGAAYRALPGVTAAMPVEVRTLDAGKSVRGGTLLALDPATAAAIVALPGGPAGDAVRTSLGELASARRTDGAVPIPGRPTALALTVDAHLDVQEPAEPLDPSWPNTPLVVTAAAVVADADGNLLRVEGTVPDADADGQRVVLPLVDAVDGETAVPAWPLELVAIELKVSSPSAATTRGTVEATGVEATEAAIGTGGGAGTGGGDGTDATGGTGTGTATDVAWMPVPFDPAAPGWGWIRADVDGPVTYTPPASAPGRIVLGDGPGMSPAIVGEIFSPDPPPVFRLSRALAEPVAIPALAGASLLAATGARVGDTLAASASGLPVTLRIVGSADAFPTVDPSVPFAVLDEATLSQVRFATNGTTGAPKEWWLATEGGAGATVAAAVAAPPISAAAVIDREALARSLTSDPIPLGIIGAFGLGSIAALLIAAIGFLVSASVSTSERLAEFALLRALGLSSRQLAGWVSAESAFLLAFGFVVGALLGALLAWLVLPFSALTSTGERAVPTPAVVVPPEALATLLAVAAALLAVTVLVVRRRVLDAPVAGVLRSRDL